MAEMLLCAEVLWRLMLPVLICIVTAGIVVHLVDRWAAKQKERIAQKYIDRIDRGQ